jgi:hypothetical protein
MPAKTKYSRSSWQKNQLRTSMNVPNLSESGCSLCYDRSIPTNLNAHVSDYQTCADVHLQLALLRYNNALCAVGQEQYQDLCCPQTKKAAAVKTTVGFMVGAILVAFLARKVFVKNCSSGKRRKVKERDGSSTVIGDDDSAGSIPTTTQTTDTRGGSSSISRGKVELEMPTSRYMKMEELHAPPIKPSRSKLNNSRSRSRGRSHPKSATGERSSSRPRSRSRGGRGSSDHASASSGRQQNSRSRGRGDGIVSELPRALLSVVRNSSRSRGDRGVSAERPKSRSRRNRGELERPQSRSRGDCSIPDRSHNSSRTRPRSRSPQTATSRSTSRSRSKSRDQRHYLGAENHQQQYYRNPTHQERGGDYRHEQQRKQNHRHLMPSTYYEQGYHSEDVEVASQAGGQDLILPTLLL